MPTFAPADATAAVLLAQLGPGLLRGFQRRMAGCVFDHGGALDKFMGDSVMATFGTPRPGPARRGRRARLRPDPADGARRVESRARGEPPLKAGIGLHVGPVALGDIGDDRRVEFAVLGDTVNTASRLEALIRAVDSALVASEALVLQVREEVGEGAVRGLRRHGPMPLRGRSERMVVWVPENGTG